MNIKHLIITRAAIKWKLWGYKGDEWTSKMKNKREFMDSYFRKSLKSQINQDFEIISVVDESFKEDDLGYFENKLENESILYIPRDSLTQNFLQILRDLILSKYRKYDYVIITRLDSDDIVSPNFTDFIQNKITPGFWVDISEHITYNVTDKNFHSSMLFLGKYTSPFVSYMENIRKLEILPYSIEHPYLGRKRLGNSYNDIKGAMTIHGNNITSGPAKTPRIDLKLSMFGIYE